VTSAVQARDAARVRGAVRAVSGDLWDLNVFMHGHVETAFEEHQAAAAVTGLLERHGFEVERGLAGYGTAFRGTLGAADPAATVAFVCEYDGLPPYGHSCGHNITTAASAGAGLALGPVAARLGLRVQVIGTPGEEGGGGKYRMADQGIFDGVDAAMLVYPGMYDIGASRSLAARAVRVEFTGKAAHAAAHPELGVNALDAMIAGFTSLGLLRQHLPPQARVHGIITDGGTLPMVVPDRTSATLIVRAESAAVTDATVARVSACFEAAALATGADVQVTPADTMAEPLLPNPPLAGAYNNALASIGREPRGTDAVGGAWSGDSGYLSHVVPLIQPQVRLTDETIPPHSHEFHQATVGPSARDTIIAAAQALALTGLELATDPALVRRIREEFAERLRHGHDHTPQRSGRSALDQDL
jgi:amidohydrolase